MYTSLLQCPFLSRFSLSPILLDFNLGIFYAFSIFVGLISYMYLYRTVKKRDTYYIVAIILDWRCQCLSSSLSLFPHNGLFMANGKGGFRYLGRQHNLSYIYAYIHWNRIEYFSHSHYYLFNSKTVIRNVWCLDTIGFLVDCLLYV